MQSVEGYEPHHMVTAATVRLPDPIVDPTLSRQQNDVILNITLSVPFDERTTMTVSGGRFVRSSNISNYDFVNNSFLMGVSWRF